MYISPGVFRMQCSLIIVKMICFVQEFKDGNRIHSSRETGPEAGAFGQSCPIVSLILCHSEGRFLEQCAKSVQSVNSVQNV